MKTPVLAKTFTYGVMHMSVSFCAGWFVSGEIMVAVGIALLEPALQIGAYYFHERAWLWYGRKHPGQAAPAWDIPSGCALHGHDHGHPPAQDKNPKS